MINVIPLGVGICIEYWVPYISILSLLPNHCSLIFWYLATSNYNKGGVFMYYVRNESNNAYFNIAMEEYILKKSLSTGDSYLLLYINDPAIIIGKHQNTIEEVNREYVKEHDIYVVRRMSGGGAVYHDRGNLNFSYILEAGRGDVNNFEKFTLPIIKALDRMGIKTQLSGRNDLTIDGKKFSGNAQYYHRNRLLHHGTILFNSRMENLSKALNVKQEKIQSKGIKSVRSRVTNIIDYLPEKRSIEEFRDLLLEYLFQEEGGIKEYALTPEDMEGIHGLVKEKYGTWEWNWGESPDFDIQKSQRFPVGLIDVRLNVSGGIIKDCRIFGDYFGSRDTEELERLLVGIKYREDEIRQVLRGVPLEEFFGRISLEEFLGCII